MAEHNNPLVTFEMEGGASFCAELYPEAAPNTVRNFIALANSGFYDGLIFHRVIAGFVIQGGDPTGTGMGGPGYHIRGEFRENGFPNPIRHERGVLSMARAQSMDSAGSQFFVMHQNAFYLDGNYAAFGRVTQGMDVVDAIATAQADRADRPLQAQRMQKVRVETYGVTYPAPEKVK